ncbi:hypothetical protein ACQZV8_03220 [Magnetococcales bacterium HHB-1]
MYLSQATTQNMTSILTAHRAVEPSHAMQRHPSKERATPPSVSLPKDRQHFAQLLDQAMQHHNWN